MVQIIGPHQRPKTMIEGLYEGDAASDQQRHARFKKNVTWYKAHVREAHDEKNRGNYVCIAGEEVFAAPTPKEAIELAQCAHPEDDGRFVVFIPHQKARRIYAVDRGLDHLH